MNPINDGRKEFAEKVQNAVKKYVKRKRKLNPRRSIASIAKEVGMSSSTLAKILDGTRVLGFRVAQEIAPTVGVSAIEGIEQPLANGKLSDYNFEERFKNTGSIKVEGNKIQFQDGTHFKAIVMPRAQALILQASLAGQEPSTEGNNEADENVVLLVGVMK